MPTKFIMTVPNPEGGWDNKRSGETKVIEHTRLKKDAEAKGKSVAKIEKVEHMVYKKDMTIQYRSSYGNDPKKSKG